MRPASTGSISIVWLLWLPKSDRRSRRSTCRSMWCRPIPARAPSLGTCSSPGRPSDTLPEQLVANYAYKESQVISILSQYCIYVSDIDRAIDFWEKTIGIPLVSRTDLEDIKEAILQSPHGGSRLQLAQNIKTEQPITWET